MASIIGIETLKITNMLKNKNLAKALSDSALGGFLAMLKSKADILGIPIKEAPQFYASSKTCSSCGHKKEKLLLSERQYNCSACGISIDRDRNAAINLKAPRRRAGGELKRLWSLCKTSFGGSKR